MQKPIPNDFAQILPLLDKAFAPSTFESILVRNLRDHRKAAFEGCLKEDGRICAGGPLPPREVGYEEEFLG